MCAEYVAVPSAVLRRGNAYLRAHEQNCTLESTMYAALWWRALFRMSLMEIDIYIR